MERKIRVHFSKRSSEQPNVGTERISIDWLLRKSDVARKYFEAVKIASATRYIHCRDRFYNFPRCYFTEERILARMSRAIGIINEYSPDLITDHPRPGMSQDYMNHFHVYFEKHRGPLLNPSPLYKNAPTEVRDAFDELNLMIHRYEDAGFSKRGGITRGNPKVHLTFGLNDRVKRYPLAEEDFEEFSFKQDFGIWLINYCEVGKPLHDIWRDDDDHVGQEVIIPLQYYSADGVVLFGKKIDECQHREKLEKFYAWWDSKRDAIESLGFKKFDPRNSLGQISVADLDRDQPTLAQKSEAEIVEFISNYQWIEHVECLELDR